jgi:hypothetical protein
MAKFHFGPQRGMFGEEFTPEPVDVSDTPVATDFKFAPRPADAFFPGEGYKGGDGLGESPRSVAFRFSQSLKTADRQDTSTTTDFKFAPARKTVEVFDPFGPSEPEAAATKESVRFKRGDVIPTQDDDDNDEEATFQKGRATERRRFKRGDRIPIGNGRSAKILDFEPAGRGYKINLLYDGREFAVAV